MTPETFLQRLLDRGLQLAISPETGKLAIYGDPTQLTDRICEYIQGHRGELLAALSAVPGSAAEPSLIDDTPSEPRAIPCYACPAQVIEQDESTWRMSPDGTVFCVQCWENRHIERAEKARAWLIDRELPTNLGERIDLLLAGPGYGCCGGHDWVVDWTGALVCHHVIEAFLRIEHEQAEEKAATGPMPAQAA